MTRYYHVTADPAFRYVGMEHLRTVCIVAMFQECRDSRMKRAEHDQMSWWVVCVEVIFEPRVWPQEEHFSFVGVVGDVRQIRFACEEPHTDILMNVTKSKKTENTTATCLKPVSR